MTSRTALLCLVLLLVAVPAMATSYVMVSDENLLQRSTAVVEARVLSVDDAPSGSPATDYMIEVDRVLAGEVSGRNLIVRVPGGVRPDGLGLHIYGMPRFGIGEQVMLFLGTRPDGTYRITHLMLGAFHETVIGGDRLLMRDLSGARELAMPGEPAGSREQYHQPRKAAAFARWVEARARGDEAPAEYFLELPEGEEAAVPQIAERFRLFSHSGRNIRWFAFDFGGHVEWRMQTGGQPPFGQNRTADAFQKGMAAWNNDGGSNVDYRYAGTTGSTQGFDGCDDPEGDCTDGISAIIFEDADGSLNDPFDCSVGGGGTLAHGGPWFDKDNPLVGPGGQLYNVTVEAEIIANSNIECFLDAVQGGPDLAMQQLFAHELGHTLGIDHPCRDDGGCPPLQSDALMHAFFHTDGRGALLNSDDRGAVRALYPGASDRPAPPTNLAGMAVSPTEVFLTWTDNAVNESFFKVQAKSEGGTYADVGNPLANVEELEVGGLQPETLYTFRVEARNGAGGSGFSNELQILMPPDLPAAPTNVVASSLSSTAVGLSWTDMADDENDFVVEMRTAESGTWSVVREGILPDSESTTITDLNPDVPYSFRVFARNEKGLSFPSDPAAVTPVDGGLTGCTPDGQTLCLLQDRFRVTVQWRNPNNGNHDAGGAAPLPNSDGSDRSGTFWFFNPANTELIVKVLDGRSINGFYWTFYGSLSNVEYWISVVDTTDGSSRTYYNPPGERCGELDTNSIPGTDQPVEGGSSLAVIPLDPADGGSGGAGTAAPVTAVTAADGTCVESDTTLCLLEDRFAVTVDWDTTGRPNGTTGVGTAVPGSDKTGYFWFFNEDNIELVVKALDGRPVNGKFWFFYGQLSDVEFDITVTDTVTGVERTFSNAFRNTCGQFETEAFDPEPEEPELP